MPRSGGGEPTELIEPNVLASGPLFIFLVPILCFFVGHLINKYHLYWLPESVGTMLVGFLFGALHYLVFQFIYAIEFDPEIFYYVLLPIIIFESGYSLKKHGLFANLGTVLLFAIFGTLFSIFFVGLGLYYLASAGIISGIDGNHPLEALIFGSLISSTDPVATLSIMGEVFHVGERENAPLVYNLVFGESVLNDGVAIVVYRILIEFYTSNTEIAPIDIGGGIGDFFVIAFGSIAVAFICGSFTALLFKKTDLKRHYSAEVLTIYLTGGVAYCCAELMGMSGILAVFFCALFISHYTWYNISTYAQITTKTTFKLFSHLAEVIIFQILGSSPFILLHKFDAFSPSFIFASMVLMIVGRFIQIFVLSGLANITRKQKITPKTQFFIFHAGLRGAISFSLALNTIALDLAHSQEIVACTVAVVMVTNVLMGGLTAPLLKLMDYMHEIDTTEFIPLVAGEQDSTIWAERQKKSYWAQKLKDIDMRYLKPFLTSVEHHADGDLRQGKTGRGDYQAWINLF